MGGGREYEGYLSRNTTSITSRSSRWHDSLPNSRVDVESYLAYSALSVLDASMERQMRQKSSMVRTVDRREFSMRSASLGSHKRVCGSVFSSPGSFSGTFSGSFPESFSGTFSGTFSGSCPGSFSGSCSRDRSRDRSQDRSRDRSQGSFPGSFSGSSFPGSFSGSSFPGSFGSNQIVPIPLHL